VYYTDIIYTTNQQRAPEFLIPLKLAFTANNPNDVHQVFYVKDMCSKPKRNPEETWEPKCHIVLPGKRKIVGVEDETDQSDDYDQFDGM
ncbi:hypothetical protein, partial [Klebsiella pneumoniae]|uniref:hypothetical protein n=1 Tax=Klebsiella pneumoniae TaxID=573 RepID=UPI0027308B9A